MIIFSVARRQSFDLGIHVIVWIWFLAAMVCGCRQGTLSPDSQVTDSLVVGKGSSILKESDSLYALGEKFRYIKKHDSAIYFHRQALNLRNRIDKDSLRLFYSNWRLAQALSVEQQVEAASLAFDQAQQFASGGVIPNDSLIQLYLTSSANKRELRDFATSHSLILIALRLEQSNPSPSKSLIARCHGLMAGIYYQEGKYGKAVESYLENQKILVSLKDKAALARSYFNASLTYVQVDEIEKALRHLDLSQKLYSSFSGTFSAEVAGILINKGEIYRNMGRLDSAHSCFMKTLKIRQEIYGNKSMFTAGAKESLANVYESLGRLDSSLYFHQGSLISLVKDFNDQDFNANPRPSIPEVTGALVDFLVNKARVLKAIFEQDTTRQELLELSMNTFMLADSLFLAYQKNLPYDDSQLVHLEEQPIPFDEIIDIGFSLYQHSGREKYLEDCFQVMEHSRASVLKDALIRAEMYNKEVIPAKFGERERNLLTRRVELVQLMDAGSEDESLLDSISKEVFTLDQQYQTLQSEIRKINPAYSMVKHDNRALSLDEMRALMKAKSSIWLEYLWGKDFIYVISIAPDDLSVNQVKKDSTFLAAFYWIRDNSRQASDSITSLKYFSDYCKKSYFLYQQLVEPSIEGTDLPNLIISSHGPLDVFSFDVLITALPETSEVDYRLPYLVNDYSMSYHYSSAFLQKQFQEQRHGRKLIALGYAGDAVTRSDRSVLMDLPGTKEEIMAIRKVMQDGDNKYILEEDATEHTFKQEIGRFNIVHLAVHGIADTVNSTNSKLLFRSGGSAGEDGSLFAHELYGLNFKQLDLAVLSACESGQGKSQTGEGIMSIARGFTYSGCPSLIMSLWKINDKTSADLVSRFYVNLASGKPIDQALAEAKREYISHVNMFNSHPAYWAAFISMGETKPIISGRPLLMYWLIGLGAIAIAGYFFWIRRR